MAREQIGICTDSMVDYEIIGNRYRGSFRKALRDYGFDKRDIDRVIDDLDCDREMVIDQRGVRFHLRPL